MRYSRSLMVSPWRTHFKQMLSDAPRVSRGPENLFFFSNIGTYADILNVRKSWFSVRINIVAGL